MLKGLMAKNKHILAFFILMIVTLLFFSWMFTWLRKNSPTKEFGAIEQTAIESLEIV